MRRLAPLVLLLAVGCSGGSSGGGAGSDACVSIRHAIQRDKQAVIDAGLDDSPAANKARRDVEDDARAARSLSDCDISDLVGDNVGR